MRTLSASKGGTMDIKQDNQIIVSNIDVRTANRIRVLQLLFHEENLTQMDIKNRLHLSGPTVTQGVHLFWIAFPGEISASG